VPALDEDPKKSQWEIKHNKDNVKVYVKKSGGSRFNKDQPYVKTEVLFNSAYSMRKIILAVILFLPKLEFRFLSPSTDYSGIKA
jgi:hypothetical protein